MILRDCGGHDACTTRAHDTHRRRRRCCRAVAVDARLPSRCRPRSASREEGLSVCPGKTTLDRRRRVDVSRHRRLGQGQSVGARVCHHARRRRARRRQHVRRQLGRHQDGRHGARRVSVLPRLRRSDAAGRHPARQDRHAADGDLPPTLDLEIARRAVGERPSSARSRRGSRTSRAKTGRTPMVYTSPGFWPSIGQSRSVGVRVVGGALGHDLPDDADGLDDVGVPSGRRQRHRLGHFGRGRYRRVRRRSGGAQRDRVERHGAGRSTAVRRRSRRRAGCGSQRRRHRAATGGDSGGSGGTGGNGDTGRQGGKGDQPGSAPCARLLHGGAARRRAGAARVLVLVFALVCRRAIQLKKRDQKCRRACAARVAPLQRRARPLVDAVLGAQGQ